MFWNNKTYSWHWSSIYSLRDALGYPLREKCRNKEFFLVRIFPHSDRIRWDTYLSVFSPNAGKYVSEKTPYLDTFHAVIYDGDFSFNENPMDMNIWSIEESFLIKKITKLDEKVVIWKPIHKEGEFISPISFVLKPPDCFRLILNLKKLNEFLFYVQFKMETINSMLTMITPNSYMAKVDPKDAYYFVPTLPEYQKYLELFFLRKTLSVYLFTK